MGDRDIAIHGCYECASRIVDATLAPIRELHKPSVDECHCCRHCVECGAIGTEWPCPTARLIYTSEELSDD